MWILWGKCLFQIVCTRQSSVIVKTTPDTISFLLMQHVPVRQCHITSCVCLPGGEGDVLGGGVGWMCNFYVRCIADICVPPLKFGKQKPLLVCKHPFSEHVDSTVIFEGNNFRCVSVSVFLWVCCHHDLCVIVVAEFLCKPILTTFQEEKKTNY